MITFVALTWCRDLNGLGSSYSELELAVPISLVEALGAKAK